METARETVAYELWMFHRMQEQLVAWDSVDFKRANEEQLALYCASLESFLVHARSLLCFFYRDRHQQTDVIADDMFAKPGTWQRPQQPPDVVRWITSMNKTMQHITSERVAPSQEWDEGAIRSHVDGLLANLNKLAPDGGPIVPRHPANMIGPSGPPKS